MKRHDLQAIARETELICEHGSYTSRNGVYNDLDVQSAIDATRLYRPSDFGKAVSRPGPTKLLSVSAESVLQAASNLAGSADCWILNFASARNVGGGWLKGANAQEESLCRASALAKCLKTELEYYAENRTYPTTLYTDYTITSSDVPVFRNDRGQLLDQSFKSNFITCPAPNASAFSGSADELRSTLRRRARNIVWLASERLGCQTLVLGAWGCGVFGNDPEEVAMAFKLALLEIDVGQALFPILGPENDTHQAFRDVLEIPC